MCAMPPRRRCMPISFHLVQLYGGTLALLNCEISATRLTTAHHHRLLFRQPQQPRGLQPVASFRLLQIRMLACSQTRRSTRCSWGSFPCGHSFFESVYPCSSHLLVACEHRRPHESGHAQDHSFLLPLAAAQSRVRIGLVLPHEQTRHHRKPSLRHQPSASGADGHGDWARGPKSAPQTRCLRRRTDKRTAPMRPRS